MGRLSLAAVGILLAGVILGAQATYHYAAQSWRCVEIVGAVPAGYCKGTNINARQCLWDGDTSKSVSSVLVHLHDSCCCCCPGDGWSQLSSLH